MILSAKTDEAEICEYEPLTHCKDSDPAILIVRSGGDDTSDGAKPGPLEIGNSNLVDRGKEKTKPGI